MCRIVLLFSLLLIFLVSTEANRGKQPKFRPYGNLVSPQKVKKRLTKERNVIIITDMEPDDRIALAIVAARMAEKVLLVGTTVMNTWRKAALARHQFSLYESMKEVPVYAGTGEFKKLGLNSTKAGETYRQEGKKILSEKKLKQLADNYKATPGQNQLKEALKQAFETAANKKLELIIFLFAPPTDLVAFLENEKYRKVIQHIYFMGGWEELKDPVELRSSYNTNMDVHATAQLFKHKHDIPMTLYSSHAIKKVFIGGSINVNNCEECVKLIFDQEVPQLQLIKKATLSWDTHLIERMPFMLKRIGDGNQGRQFCPADTLVVIGFLNQKMIKNYEKVSIEINESDKTERGYKMDFKKDEESKIEVVDIDKDIFFKEIKNSFTLIINEYNNRENVALNKKTNNLPINQQETS